jgi:hypothetical protein
MEHAGTAAKSRETTKTISRYVLGFIRPLPFVALSRNRAPDAQLSWLLTRLSGNDFFMSVCLA